MTFTSAVFPFFFLAVCVCFFAARGRGQAAVLAAASAVFYLANCRSDTPWRTALPVAVLYASVLFSFFCAKAIARSEGAKRKRLTAFAVAVSLAVLAFFKYCNFFLPTVFGETAVSIGLPLGISFYTFASISYLVDVSRGDTDAETSLVRFTAFLTFFGTITSGPICRARTLLPQMREDRRFDAKRAADGLRLVLFGAFEWVAAANVLGLFVNEIFENIPSYGGAVLVFAAAAYSVQLYCEFAGYSDVARGIGLILGYDLPVNFKTPYFATNFSGFWNRWHISLSSWLQDYLFMPLVWGRWTSRIPVIGKRFEKPPTVSSVAVVFFLSGLWHGNTAPFVLWGTLQAAYRVGEELLHRFYKKPQKKPKLPLRVFKTASVFVLWTASLVFFRIGLLADSSVALCGTFFARIFAPGSFFADVSAAVQNGFYAKPVMVAAYFAYLLIVLFIVFYTDWLRCFRDKDRHIALRAAKWKTPARWAAYYLLICLTLAGYIMQSGGFGTVSFAYANF